MKLTFLSGVMLLLILSMSLFAFAPATAPDIEPGGLEFTECVFLAPAEDFESASTESGAMFSDIFIMENSAQSLSVILVENESQILSAHMIEIRGLSWLSANKVPKIRGLDENKFI